MIGGSACGKIILFGEHAVVYGRPALAVPLPQLRARATVRVGRELGVVIHARDLDRTIRLDADPHSPLAEITRLTLDAFKVTADLELTVESDIPLASGMGSGAAVSTAIVRALAAHFDRELTPAQVSALVYETEKLYHGTPSGIDNTVIAFEQPVRYVRGQAIQPFTITRPFTLLIADTGVPSPTAVTVSEVRRGWQAQPARYEAIFDAIAAIVTDAQEALAGGENERLGELMTRNQRELEALGVSSPVIEQLLAAGLRAGAGGGKLSGGGRGGNVIFYVTEAKAGAVEAALRERGAVNVIETTVAAFRAT